MDLILYAVPVFFLMILLELAYGCLRGRNTYRINDTVNSLSLGSLSRLQGLVVLGFSGLVYEWVVARWQLSQLPDNRPWVWIACFVLYDLAYYWKHRLGHEVALFWGSHVAHHQSEDFNLGTALRQTSIDFYGFLFYLPFFVLGFPAEILFTVVSLNLIYQFWVHTEHVPKLGPLEWVFVTPSNHRVHHARNDRYVDRNYGGVFILWDRLFGSFQEEIDSEPVVFGLRKPLQSWNPLWANVHVYWRLLLDCSQAPGLGNKIRVLFKPPGWRVPGMKKHCRLQRPEFDLSARYDPPVPAFTRYYTLAQFIVTLGASFALLLNAGQLANTTVIDCVGYLAFSMYVHGSWLENSNHALWLELMRLGGALGLVYLVGLTPLIGASLVGVVALSMFAVIFHGSRQRTNPGTTALDYH